MFSLTPAVRGPQSAAISTPVSKPLLPSPLNAKYTTHERSFTVSVATSIGILGAAYRNRAATLRRATFLPNDCPRNGQTLKQLHRHVTYQYSDNASETFTFIKDLLNVEATERSGIGPMNFGKASGNLIVEELLNQTLWPVNVNEAGRFAESQLNFMKRVVAVINKIFNINLPEDCVVQSEQDPSKFKLDTSKIQSDFEVLNQGLVTVIKHKETGVTLTMIRHFPTNFPDRMPSNTYCIKHDPEAIESHCKKIVQNLIDLYKDNTFSEGAENNHLFISNRSMIGALTMIANKNEKKIEIFELSGKKPDLATIFSSIAAGLALPTNDGR